MLWAWAYPCDLQYIDTNKTGVAFLAGKIYLAGNGVIVKPRIQSLKIKDGTYMMAVVRVESDKANYATFSDEQLNVLTRAILDLLSIRPVQSLQIDYDASQSERNFYDRFLHRLNEALPDGMPLSITALASWCLGDPWIKAVPSQNVVPMFFSMGRDRQRILNDFRSGGSLAKLFRMRNMGLSIDEPDVLAALPALSEHVYLFSSKGWNINRARSWVKSFETGSENWKELAK
jgi:hypothetical protein